MEQNFKMLAKTFFGFEEILAKELRQLGAQEVEIGNRAVSFVGDKGFMYKANLCLRTALKILKPIHTATIESDNDLYQLFYDFPWTDYLEVDSKFVIDSVVYGELFTHSQYASQKAKDGLVDRFRDEFQARPSVEMNRPDLRINLHIQNDQCTISLDSSGASLHHRGYRTATNIAPLNEVLAAGLIQLSGWKGNTDFYDPMCGSGTILIEAALFSCKIPANINRKSFAFEKWKDWDESLMETIKTSQLKKIINPNVQIKGSDKAPSAVEKAIQNVENANLSDFITIEKKDFFQVEKETKGPLHLLTNPPYGERLEGDMNVLYQGIGDSFKQSFPNTQAWMISSNMEALKHVGLRPSRKIKLFNGKLESRLLLYPIYEGTKRIHKLKED
ncbi:RNA methyltransferase [Flavobacteriaceae bacterium]|jgi:putative N6-adenine-specific DNA methylase|nr:RNA methyltransferase [Flavobacteriaceae bacterium]MDB4027526.1 RNA methyltransferase [bacterium]MBT4313261.1 RNA methyltransferase [Flavobacteriaceae bacterium]MBT5091008.1 RNA methyltransferase [Flavobacteriaceae bacterium]MBT5283648.1 RNA methyltransferase [Flavobacteriaceae bacterium]|tara:strand:+ start:167 stop:1330 length:1164 start_codon:yes stop_codon:yes gene_type:complete